MTHSAPSTQHSALKPAALRPGDVIGIASPSFGAAGLFPHRTERGVAYLESLGFRVRIATHALGVAGYLSGTPQERAADIHELFADREVRAIIAGIGGDHACHLLPLLDFDLIRANPKIFMGMSDITVLNVAIYAMTGLVTFNGPLLTFGLAEYPRTLAYTEEQMLRVLTRAEPAGVVGPAESWTDEFLDWATKADLTRPRALRPSSGWTWLKAGRGRVTGRLLGGCLESLEHLRGTPYRPSFADAILFLETSEEMPSPQRVDALLMDYENMGVLGCISGLLFANPYGYTDAARQELRAVLLERTRGFDFPIVTDMDFGHTQPMMTLPLGCRAEIDPGAQRFALVESAVVERV
jgi:muramoyltetrapeptide carboxypeptidase LdcA involved in peptidoglycan recycling